MKNSLNYSDVCLVPKFGALNSRSEADTSVKFLGENYKLPIIPSNMECCIDFNLAKWLSENEYFYVLHRFYSYDLILNWVESMQSGRLISISLGVKQVDYDFVNALADDGLRVDCITIDIAHGFSKTMEKMVQHVRNRLPKTKIIAGNIFGDADSVKFLANQCCVDAIKVGLAFGKACTTYNKTGFASPMFSSGLEASSLTHLPIIGDGGVRENGDIAKAMRAGYTMVMAGSIFAACTDSPAPFFDHAKSKKIYYGSASISGKHGDNKHVEGRSVVIDCNCITYEHKLKEISDDLSSSISYAGGKNLSALQCVEYKVF